MPRATKKDKFFLYKAHKSGYWKNKMLFGVNHNYEGGDCNLSMQDLIDFMEENQIEPSRVPLNSGFTAHIKV